MDPARRERIFGLALPIIGGMVSQNLLKFAATAMIGVPVYHNVASPAPAAYRCVATMSEKE